MSAKPFLINGKWQHSSDVVTIHAPYDNRPIDDVCWGQPEHITAAIEAAHHAFDTSRHWPLHRRHDALIQLKEGLSTHAEELARTITLEAGKPITMARVEVARALHTVEEAAKETLNKEGSTLPMDSRPWGEHRFAMIERFPVGPMASITPFNFPLNLVLHKLCPAMAVGNTVVHKPAPQTPLTSLKLAEILAETDLPPGVINCVPCSNDTANTLIEDERIRLISFTGSDSVGWGLKQRAPRKKVLLECGGNSGVVVHSDADLDSAVTACVNGGFLFAGQSCISVQRIFVEKSVYDPFLQALIKQAKSLVIGDPLDEHTQVSCMISEGAARRADSWIQAAVQNGAVCQLGGTREKAILAPTILTDTKPEMDVNCQEVFAPIVTVSPYEHFDDAVVQLNQSPFGLQAGVFTQDVDRIHRAYQDLQVGGLMINESPTWRMDHMPYGGVKNSGNTKEGIRYAMQEQTWEKLLVLRFGGS